MQEEIRLTVQMLVDIDISNMGCVSENAKAAAKMQGLDIRYTILSPDGISISMYGEDAATINEAWAAFETWKSRYERQGYYSSNRGRIELDKLINYCRLKGIVLN